VSEVGQRPEAEAHGGLTPCLWKSSGDGGSNPSPPIYGAVAQNGLALLAVKLVPVDLRNAMQDSRPERRPPRSKVGCSTHPRAACASVPRRACQVTALTVPGSSPGLCVSNPVLMLSYTRRSASGIASMWRL